MIEFRLRAAKENWRLFLTLPHSIMQNNELESFRSLVTGPVYSEYKMYTDEDGDTHFEWYTEAKVIGVCFYQGEEEEGKPIVLFAAKKGVYGATQQGFCTAHEVFAQLQKELEETKA